jgi:DNA-binding NtrC family response regulator/tetratricopeptide (TPR) repeat protein
MRVFADRFLLDDADVVDLATGEVVRLSVEPSPSRQTIAERLRLCDAIAVLRHPLLAPLVDYGLAEDTWFEAHAAAPPLRASDGQARRLALHLVRFLREHGIELTAAAASRHVRTATVRGHGAAPRPLGWRLMWRAAVDAVRLTLESGGPPGVVCLTLSGPVGSGLRSARLVLARAARLAGFAVLDSRLSSICDDDRHRHRCVIDWLPQDDVLPSVLAHAGAHGGARHVWLRFTRQPARGTFAVPLDPFGPAEMMSMLYRDPDAGPDHEDVRDAIRQSRGWPGGFIQRLAGAEMPRPVALVHETAPEYVSAARYSPQQLEAGDRDAGVRRLVRVMRAAENVAARGRHSRAERLLRRCVDALAARGASGLAVEGAVVLGDLLQRRGRAGDALDVYMRARNWADRESDGRLLLAIGRAHALAERRREAEGAFRTALAHSNASTRGLAAALLAGMLLEAGEFERAEELIQAHSGAHTTDGLLVLARLQFRKGDVAAAAASARAVLTSDVPADAASEAHVLLARVHHAIGEIDAARRAAADALVFARRSHDAALVIAARATQSAVAPANDREAARQQRLLAAAERLPPGRASQIREILLPRPSVARRLDGDVHALETMLGLAEAAADDERAVAAVVRHVHEVLTACSTAAWTSEQVRLIAGDGKPWAANAIARLTINAGRGSFSPGVVTEAAEPIRAGGATIGCVAARWTAGRAPAEARVRGVLRLAAAAVAPAIAGLNTPAPRVATRPDSPDALLGTGPSADRLRGVIARAAAAPFPVLIEGESGSGKELVARAIHAHGPRRARRFCAVNCAALTDDLLEAELFGHARGAFTGAAAERAGLFEDADQGTLFLDEVAELSARAQAKLLRVLQEGEVRRVGENMPRRVDVRIVAASNRPLDAEVDAGRFRADLRFRLDVVRVVVPPLRDRADEIPGLAERIWRDAAARVGTRATIGQDLMLALARYTWPGNVRELQNVLAALAVHAPARGRVPASLLPARIAEAAGRVPVAFDEARNEFERKFVEAALARAAGRKGVAAAQLGVTRQGLDKMIKRLGIER